MSRQKSKKEEFQGLCFRVRYVTKIITRNLLGARYSARETAKLRDVCFHDLRPTYATRLVQSGIDLYTVKELLGHKTITMTMRYAHHFPESLWQCVEVLDTRGTKRDTGNKKELR